MLVLRAGHLTELALIECGVMTFFSDQFSVRPLFNETAAVKDKDGVHMGDG